MAAGGGIAMAIGGRKYPVISLRNEQGQRSHLVHKLVLEAFIGPRPDGLQACHNNGDRHDNRASNLRWDTASENSLDVVRHGRHHHANRTHCGRGHRLAAPNLVGGDPFRKCRACATARVWAKDNGITSEQIIQARADYRYEMLTRKAA